MSAGIQRPTFTMSIMDIIKHLKNQVWDDFLHLMSHSGAFYALAQFELGDVQSFGEIRYLEFTLDRGREGVWDQFGEN